MQQRSKQYDWFKGPQKNDGHKDWRKSAKTTWKFTKIFLYFSLFFFSMWGCIQVFTHKTSTSTSQGVTFANGDSSLSPQEKIFTIVNDNGDDPKDIYLSYKAESSFEAINIYKGKEVIADLNAYLKKIGVESPTNARKGGNYLIKIRGLNGEYVSEGNTDRNGIIYVTEKDGSTHPLTYTTAPNTNNLYNTRPVISKDYIFKYYLLNEEGKAIDKTKTITYTLNQAAIDALEATNNFAAISFNIKLLTNLVEEKVDGTKTYKQYLEEVSTGIENGAIVDVSDIIRYNTKVLSILATIGKPVENKEAPQTGKITYQSIPAGFNASSNWIPITTWSKAWGPDGGFGPFYGIFVFPISYVTNAMIDSLPILAGWESFITIALVVIIISLLMFAINWKNTFQQTRMQELSSKKAIIDAKYAPYKGNKQMEQRQKQEVSDLYKKEGISPLSSLGGVFITMPFFLAMWRVIGSIDHIKGTTWIGIKFSATSWRELFGNLGSWAGGWVYFPLMILAAGLQMVSQIMPQVLTRKRDKNRINIQQKEAMKKGNKTQKIMMFVFAFMALIFSAGLQVYFIIRSLWRIGEVLITHHLLIYQRKRKIAKGIK